MALIGVAILAYALLYVLFAMNDKRHVKTNASTERKKIDTTHIKVPGDQVDLRRSWMGKAGDEIALQKNELFKQQQTLKDLAGKFEGLDKALREGKTVTLSQTPNGQPTIIVRGDPGNDQSPPEQPADADKKTPTTTLGGKAINGSEGTKPSNPGSPSDPGSTPATTTLGAVTSNIFPPKTPSQVAGLPPGVFPPPLGATGGKTGVADTNAAIAPMSIGQVSFAKPTTHDVGGVGGQQNVPAQRNSAISGTSTGTPTGANAKKAKELDKSFLPIGFVKATILGGIDAPTGAQSQNSPMPIFLRLKDLATLPNNFRANVKECFLVGSAYGDISSERAYGRLETLSCIRHDKKVIEAKAHGVLYGEDGKLGMRGRLITKQGQILMNALMAGVISGIGQGIQYGSTTTTIGSAGISTTPNAGDGFKAGLGTRMGRAMDRLADYYIRLADKVFPVIEIDAQREIDVAFTKGIELEIPLPEEYPDEDYSDEEY